MGSSQSTEATQRPNNNCQWCAASHLTAELNQQRQWICGRCASAMTHEHIPLKAIHIFPFAETLPSEALQASAAYFEHSYWRPYFKSDSTLIYPGYKFQINQADFKVAFTFPFAGIVTSKTQMFLVPPAPALSSVQSATIAPLKESLVISEVKDFVDEVVHPYFSEEDRQVIQGEVILHKNVQFKVLQMNPPAGIIDENTTLYTESEPIPDLEKVHLRPIYEGLPNSEKKIDEDTIFSKYLKPFLQGTARILRKGETVNVEGVDFYVSDSVPDKGVVMFGTLIFSTGGPITADEIRRQQMLQDEQLAMQLQEQMMREEYGDSASSFIMGPANHQLRHATSLIQQRISAIISQLPANHPQRAALLEMQRQLAASSGSPEAFFQLIQAARDREEMMSNRGAESSVIQQLPVSTFRSLPEESKSTPSNLEHSTCRVCLCEYEDGEELRTLPCFHRYHKECIDKWLTRDKKCPICKHEIN